MNKKILQKLISFETESSKSNLPLIFYAKKHFEKNEYKTIIYRHDNKANLFAFSKNTKPKIILASHSDTVPASDLWKTNPLKLKETENDFVGLGVSDMKSFMAVMFSLAETKNDKLAFLLTFNEEVDFAGAKLINKKIMNLDDFVIVGEPTSGKAILNTKGALAYKASFNGPSGHGSQANNIVSAVEESAKFVNYLRGKIKKAKYLRDSRYADPEISLNFGLIRGGEAINKVAENTELIFEFRITNKSQEKIIEKILSDSAKKIKAKVKLKKTFSYEPFNASRKIALTLGKAKIAIAHGASYATEATLYAKLTPNIIIFGPGDIKNAHQANESISKKQIVEYERKIKTFLETIDKINF